jgi:hypothetical protein
MTQTADPVADATERLEAARQAETEARDALTALRERVKRGEDPPEVDEWQRAGIDVERAGLRRQGAEEALAAAQEQELQARRAAIAARIDDRDDGTKGRLEQAAVDALAACLEWNQADHAVVGRESREMVGARIPEQITGRPADKYARLRWRGGGWGGSAAIVQHDTHVVQAEDPAAIVTRVSKAAARQAAIPVPSILPQ